jgi:hypothetical protein
MKPIKSMTLGELAAFICTHLKSHEIPCVLSGGACVTIYSRNAYPSYDLDFIEQVYTTRNQLRQVLGELGFIEKNRYFVHNETDFFIEFPSGPLSVGSEPLKDIHEIQFETGTLSLLSPTDCVKDRLAAFYHWNDLQALKQAKMVAKNHQIDLQEIKRWSDVENQLDKFEKTKTGLTNKRRHS